MDVEQWTDLEVLDCPSAGFRVALALAMTGVRNTSATPEHKDVYCTLKHCTGALRCGFSLPATSADLVLSNCPAGELLLKHPGIATDTTAYEELSCNSGETCPEELLPSRALNSSTG